MSFKTINYEEAHTIVDSNKNLFWDGWTIVDWKPYKDALYKKNGLFRDGKWGVSRRYTPDANGWKVPAKYVDR
jgi:hypothetical protein